MTVITPIIATSSAPQGRSDLWNHSVPIWAPVNDPVDWKDCNLELTVVRSQVRQTGDKPVVGAGMDVPGARRVCLLFRCPDSRNGYEWTIDPEAGELVADVRRNDVVQRIGSAAWQVDSDPEVHVTVMLRDDTITTIIQGHEVSVIHDETWRADGWRGNDVGLGAPANARSLVSGLSVTDPAGRVLWTLGETSLLDCGDVDDDGRFLVAERSHGLTSNGAAWAFLHKEFMLDPRRVVAKARLYVTASSPEPARQFVYRIGVNGTAVGNGPVRSVGDETRYDVYDVTESLRCGEQASGDKISDGIPNCIGIQAWTTSDQRVQAELHVVYEDGGHLTIGTDSTWRALDGTAVYGPAGSIGTGYYAAPRENLRGDRYPWGFDAPGFDEARHERIAGGDLRWCQAVERPAFDRDRLLMNPGRNVIIERCEPVHVERFGDASPRGVIRLDFGKTLVGGVEIPWPSSVPANQSEVVIRYGELSEADGSPRWRTNAGNHYCDTWSLGSESAGQIGVTWGLRVFRYVEIEGLPSDFDLRTIRGIGHVYPLYADDLDGSVAMCSDDDDLNRIVTFCRNTMEQINGNLLVDSWNREREPYEADAYLQARCNAAISADVSLADYSLDYLLERRTWPTEWPFYLVLMARDQYLRSGDVDRLRARYDRLRQLLPTRWLDPNTGLICKDFGNDGTGSRMDYDIVDWPPSERDGYRFGPVNTVVNAVAYGAYRAMAEIDEVLGTPGREYASIADRLRASINRLLWDDDARAYADGLDRYGRRLGHHAAHASAFAVSMGVADGPKARAAARMLADRGMVVSVYAAPFLLEAMMIGGQTDAAYDLLTGSGLRSWNGMIRQGAGSTMEAWSETLKPNVSCAHPWSASPLFIVVELLAGIRSTSGGFRTFDIAPSLPGQLDRLDVTLPTILGNITVNQRRRGIDGAEGGVVDMHIVVPAGATATLRRPGSRSDETLPPGTYDLTIQGRI
ncbi:alpha-L-rhamnosidase N-terminal domain-containing protein [Bifidobacterium simiarum]|uniref:alpha-L-rhamnosidase n=1 Tax=Bifidobacterium simiarum TaxID=2045441 RepID=A0A2M9HFS6_9BIFI|nr:alpha-L-rhamnosidase N-terminal domain-containing protein [Bifidobacterium simiarum]PJM75675.1 hypothetical protein CSQ87_04465 [Bifidobacterium simiarum]